MLGAIIGDIVGSRFEFNNHRSKDFKLFTKQCEPTDDSIMTIAVAKALLISKHDYSDLSNNAIKCMQEIGRQYPYCGYGGRFSEWMFSNNPQPYNSYGNGSAMRVSPVGYVARSIEEAKLLSRKVTEISHNHPEGIKGAEATSIAVYMARTGKSKEKIRKYVEDNYYRIDFTIDEIRDTYRFNETCQNTVPQAFEAFFESKDFEDALRIAISVGGDSDTLAAICCGIAGAYYGIPEEIKNVALTYLDDKLLAIIKDFEEKYKDLL